MAMRTCWKGLEEVRGGGERRLMVWTLRYVAFARRWGGGGGSVLEIFVFVLVEVHCLLVVCSGRSMAN